MLVLNNLIKLFILKKNEELSNKRKMAGKKLTLNIINDTDSGTAGKDWKTGEYSNIVFHYSIVQNQNHDYSLDHYYRLAKSRLEGRLRHIRCWN